MNPQAKERVQHAHALISQTLFGALNVVNPDVGPIRQVLSDARRALEQALGEEPIPAGKDALRPVSVPHFTVIAQEQPAVFKPAKGKAKSSESKPDLA